MLFRKTRCKVYEEMSPKQIAEVAESYKDQSNYLLSCLRQLAYLMKEATIESPEIDSDGFRKRVDDMVNGLDKAETTRDLQKSFDGGKETMIAFIKKEKKYFEDKDGELKKLIDFLRSTLTSVMGENRSYNGELYEQNLRIGKLTELDDIRKIKESLKAEVATMQKTIRAKQENEEARANKLAREVALLRNSLEEYKGAAMTDPLTKASNRLGFDTDIRRCVEEAELQRRPLSLLMCDIDDFRSFNTRYGHQAADVVLQVFVAKCKAALREPDIVARYGGDEFAIILPNTKLKEAVRVAQRICQTIASNSYAYEGQNTKTEFSFTCTIGVGESHKRDKATAIIERADKAMYVAKNAGKGCVRSEKDILEETQAKAA